MIQVNLRLIVAFLSAILLTFGVGGETDPDTDAPVERNWKLRFGVVFVENDGGVTASAVPGAVHVGVSTGTGFGGGVSMERRITPLVGVEFGVSGAVLDMRVLVDAGIEGVSTSTETVTFTPITVGVNFHLVREGPVDVYVGPMIALASYTTLSVGTGLNSCWWPDCWSDEWWTTGVRWQSHSELTWGARVGAGFAFGNGRWSLETSLSYLDTSYEIQEFYDTGATSIEIDPLMFSIGAGFRF